MILWLELCYAGNEKKTKTVASYFFVRVLSMALHKIDFSYVTLFKGV